jgi:hypothetical protein
VAERPVAVRGSSVFDVEGEKVPALISFLKELLSRIHQLSLRITTQ